MLRGGGGRHPEGDTDLEATAASECCWGSGELAREAADGEDMRPLPPRNDAKTTTISEGEVGEMEGPSAATFIQVACDEGLLLLGETLRGGTEPTPEAEVPAAGVDVFGVVNIIVCGDTRHATELWEIGTPAASKRRWRWK